MKNTFDDYIPDHFKRRIWHEPNCPCGLHKKGVGFMELPSPVQVPNPTVFDLTGRAYMVQNEDIANDTASALRSFLPMLMQVMNCTGLRDKNKKLIYKGDIVKIDDGIGCKGAEIHRAEVDWLAGEFGFGFKRGSGDAFLNFSESNAITFEIIGNKFESPELLPTDSSGPSKCSD